MGVIKQYAFLRGKVATPGEILEEDRRVAEASRLQDLEVYLSPENAEPYAKRIFNKYNRLVRAGNVGRESMAQVVNSAMKKAESYWGIPMDFEVQILPADEMLDAEADYIEKLNKELRTKTYPKPALPSPSFLDHLNGKAFLSDRYIVLRIPESRYRRDIYYDNSGNAQPEYHAWNEGVLKATVVCDAGNFALRMLRGETGEDYLRMLNEVPGIWTEGMLRVLGAADFYALPRILPEGGLPVLYRRFMDIYMRPETQHAYTAMKTLADDMGIKAACLFDELQIGRLQVGIAIMGYMHSAHPNHTNKDAMIRGTAENLPYTMQSISFPEVQLRFPRG